jgi:hypothetical protein
VTSVFSLFNEREDAALGGLCEVEHVDIQLRIVDDNSMGFPKSYLRRSSDLILDLSSTPPQSFPNLCFWNPFEIYNSLSSPISTITPKSLTKHYLNMPPTKNTGASWVATGFQPIAHEEAEWQCTAPNPNDPKKLPVSHLLTSLPLF